MASEVLRLKQIKKSEGRKRTSNTKLPRNQRLSLRQRYATHKRAKDPQKSFLDQVNMLSDSDIEIKKIAPMKPVKKPPNSPTEDILKSQERKISTRLMIHEALKELKTRKGVSSYAIKKYLEEKYNVETDKVKYLIKKTLKTGVEDGSIVQVKGIGASGSFKLAAVKGKPKKKPKTNKEKTTKEQSTKEKKVKEKPKKENMEITDKKKMDKGKTVKIDVKDAKEKVTKNVKPSEKEKKEKKGKKEVKEKAGEKRKGGKAEATPAKKRAIMMKRKSIGSIIKPPKMKPKKV